MRSFYSVLGCEENCATETIKQTYFALLRRLHPDKSAQSDLDEFILVNRAWSVLGSATAREKYDYWLREQRLREAKELIGQEIGINQLTDSETIEEDCRCGGTYELDLKELDKVLDYGLVECSNCSLLLKIKRRN
ncbi:dnaJ domain-containing protein [Ditylenchus destructor]|uniref:DnaJ domain-containing protein n=1 Tax=Ditylenchus destructor TaxID=166010 RepID=A0AAD4N564_9BILA|nr:dnaJ domain-containing protein [Ditylenchus destructor]